MISDFADINHVYDATKNTTTNILSKYEKVKIIGLRAEQIERGAPIYVDIIEPFNSRLIAHQELKENKIPFMVCRKLPNGNKEYWKLSDMIIL
jgi:DNA-directed RNA polymerase I, II, and III subunit RPABC2